MQSSTNGCCAHTHSEAGGNRLVGVLIGAKPKIEPDTAEQPSAAYSSCDASFLRAKPGEVLDLVGAGRTVEVCVDLLREAEPIAVLMPWARYRELIEMRDRIAAITGGFQPAGR